MSSFKLNPRLQIPLAYLATLGPLGHMRPAPGTIGSLFAVVTGYIIAGLGAGVMAIATIIVTILGVLPLILMSITGRKDASEVIIDEVAGQWVVLIILPLDPLWFAGGFLLFRFLILPSLALLRWQNGFLAVLALWQMILLPAC